MIGYSGDMIHPWTLWYMICAFVIILSNRVRGFVQRDRYRKNRQNQNAVTFLSKRFRLIFVLIPFLFCFDFRRSLIHRLASCLTLPFIYYFIIYLSGYLLFLQAVFVGDSRRAFTFNLFLIFMPKKRLLIHRAMRRFQISRTCIQLAELNLLDDRSRLVWHSVVHLLANSSCPHWLFNQVCDTDLRHRLSNSSHSTRVTSYCRWRCN